MDSKIGALAVAVMKSSKEVQAENEKLIGLVADQVRQFKELEASMPALKKEAFDEFYKLAENIKAELTDIAAFNAKSAVESNYRAMGERNAVYLGELTAKIDAAKKALLEQIKPEIIKETDASVRGYLASAEGAEKVRNAIEKNAGPLLAAFESSGTAFIDAYQGTFKPGVSKAKRGQLWTFYGNTVLCTADTNKEPVAFGTTDKIKNWVIVAASGAPGASVVSSGGGGSFSFITPFPSATADPGSSGQMSVDGSTGELAVYISGTGWMFYQGYTK